MEKYYLNYQRKKGLFRYNFLIGIVNESRSLKRQLTNRSLKQKYETIETHNLNYK